MTRVRKIFPNHEIAHLWANQSLPDATNNSNTFYFEEKKIFSYGGHYLAAKLINDNTIVVNSNYYSNTTAKHLSYINNAIDYSKYTNCFKVPETDLKAGIKYTISGRKYDCSTNHKENLKYYFKIIKNLSTKVIRARTAKSCYISEIETTKSIILQYCEVFKCKSLLTASNKNILNAKIDQLSEKYLKLEKAKKAKLKILEEENIQKFLDFEIRQIWNVDKVYLRINTDKQIVETSKGVEVPLQRCIELWPLVLHSVKNSYHWKENGENFKIGYYKINEILPDGTIKAGCHIITFNVLQDVAQKLGLV